MVTQGTLNCETENSRLVSEGLSNLPSANQGVENGTLNAKWSKTQTQVICRISDARWKWEGLINQYQDFRRRRNHEAEISLQKAFFGNQSIVNQVYCSCLQLHNLGLTLSELLNHIKSVLLHFSIYVVNGDHHKFLLLILMLKPSFHPLWCHLLVFLMLCLLKLLLMTVQKAVSPNLSRFSF